MQRAMHLTTMALVFAAWGVGCDTSTVRGPGGKELTLVSPADQTLRRGKTSDVAVQVNRSEFTGAVTLEVNELPEGVQVKNSKLEIPAGHESTNVQLHADPNAALVTDHRVILTAKAAGMEVARDFKITITQ